METFCNKPARYKGHQSNQFYLQITNVIKNKNIMKNKRESVFPNIV